VSRGLTILLLTLFVHCWPFPALAEFALHLKNGGRIVVQSYREEGRMIKFHGLGGEVGISKDQIARIEKIGQSPASPQQTQLQAPAPSPQATERPITPEEERAKEEKEYHQKLVELTGQLKEVRDRYSQLLRGTTSAEPSQLVTEEQIKASQADVISRFRDATSNPSEPAPVRVLTPSPFSSLPPTIIEEQPAARAPTTYENLPYNETQKEFSELRRQANELEKERERLINEMRQKNMSVGSLFLE
jgi:hypothetical protein